MVVYSDNFNRTASTLGVTSTGSAAWRVVQGSWSTNGTRAVPAATSPAPIAVLDTIGFNTAVSIDAYGGAAVYARVKDANNWIRARVDYYYTSSSSTYYVTTYNYLADMMQGSGGITNQSCSTTNQSACTTPGEYGYDSSYTVSNRRLQSTSQTPQTSTTNTYYWRPILEQSVGGTITILATGTSQTSRQTTLSLRVQGTSATMTHGTDTRTANVPADTTTKAHGFGYGTTTVTDGGVFDDFTLDTLNTAPNAPTLTSPTGNANVDYSQPIPLSWTFSDPDAGDYQSKADLQWRVSGAATWTTILGAASTASTYTFPANQWSALTTIEWQVATYDSTGTVGPWSSSGFFVATPPTPTPTITAPTAGASVPQSNTLAWSEPNQDAYQVRLVADSTTAPGTADPTTVYFDTGTVADATTRSYTLSHPVNGRVEHTQVRVTYQGITSAWADVRTPVSYTPPATPSAVITTNDAAANLTVAITNPTPTTGQPTVVSHDIFVDDGLGTGPVRKATGITPGATWTYPWPVGGYDYAGTKSISIVAIASNGTTANVYAT